MAPKRSFYEDDKFVVSKPGFSAEIDSKLEEKESSHGNISFIHGMGIRTTPILEQYTNQARLFLHEKLSYYGAEVSTQISAFQNELHTLQQEVHSIIKEPVLPNLIYVLTATLTGSILVNRRALPLRFITPVVFGGAAFRYYMPNSFEQARLNYDHFEETNFPEVSKLRQELAVLGQGYKRAFNGFIDDANIELQRSVHTGRVYLKSLLEDDQK